jgi:hypothetical protein
MQLAIDCEVEQREVMDPTVNRQPRSHFPDMLGFQRCLLTYNPTGFPGFGRFLNLFGFKQCGHIIMNAAST